MSNSALRINESPILVFYDGGCGMCSREIALLRKLDSRKRIQWLDINDSTSILECLGLNYEVAMRRFHILDADGEIQNGAQAFLTIWRQMPGIKWLARLLRIFPGTRNLERLYCRFADWRYERRRGSVCAMLEGPSGR